MHIAFRARGPGLGVGTVGTVAVEYRTTFDYPVPLSAFGIE
jgi:hypothetical protein